MEFLKARIEGVYGTPQGSLVALEQGGGEEILPIFVSRSQAKSIQLGLSGKEPPRPLTHDIFLQVIEDQNLEVESVAVDDLLERTFTAELRLTRDDRIFPYDVRPSDAIALAVRGDADIFVAKAVMDRAGKRKENLLKGTGR